MRALTPAASEVASLVGVQTSFSQAAEVTLQKLCGLRLSESSVERVTEGAGERLAKLLEDKVTFGERQPWTWQRDARGKTCVMSAWMPPEYDNKLTAARKRMVAWRMSACSTTRVANTTSER